MTDHLPSAISLHGKHHRPSAVGGLLPRGAISTLHLTGSNTAHLAAIADLAAGIATDPTLAALTPTRASEPRRPLAGLWRGVGYAPEAVAIVTSGSATAHSAHVAAAALTRGAGRLPIAVIRALPSPAGDMSIFNHTRAVADATRVDVGAIILTQDYDAGLLEQALRMRSSFPTAAIVLASRVPADVPEEFLGARIVVTDSDLTYEPMEGLPVTAFKVAWEKAAVIIGDEEVAVYGAGPRRSHTVAVKKEPKIVAEPAGRVKMSEAVNHIYLLSVPPNRVLSEGEWERLGGRDAIWTSDRLSLLKKIGAHSGLTVAHIVFDPMRDPGRIDAEGDASWLRDQCRAHGLSNVEISLTQFGIPWENPRENPKAAA